MNHETCTMMTCPDVLRRCLLAFVDVQVTQFCQLSNALSKRSSAFVPRTAFNIYRSGRGDSAVYLVVSIQQNYKDGSEATWSIGMHVTSDFMEISANVELDDNASLSNNVSAHSIFSLSETTSDCNYAVEIIARFANEISTYVNFIEEDPI